MVAAFPLIGESFAQTLVALDDASDAELDVKSAKVTAPNQITIEFTAPVTAVKDGFGKFTVSNTSLLANGMSVTDLDREVTSFQHIKENKIFRLIIDGEPLGTNASGAIDLNSDPDNPNAIKISLPDPANLDTTITKRLATTTDDPVTDGQAPQIKSVRIIDNDNDADPTTPPTGTLSPRVEIVYTEPVAATTANYTFHDRNVNSIPSEQIGAIRTTVDTDNPTIAAPTTVGNHTHILTLSGSPLPADATGTITFNLSHIAGTDPKVINGPVDISGNVLVATADHPLVSHHVEAGQIPTVVSVMFVDATDPSNIDVDMNQIRVKFSETLDTPVTYDNFTNLVLNDDSFRNPMVPSPNVVTPDPTDPTVYFLNFVGPEIPTGATGTINIAPIFDTEDPPKAISLMDVAGNPVKAEMAYEIIDGQKPTIISSEITGPNEISIEFSESVKVTRDNFGDFYVGDNVDEANKRDLTLLNNNMNVIKFRVSGEPIGTSEQGIINTSLDLTVDDGDNPTTAIAGITDLVKSPNTNTITSINVIHPVLPGQAPEIKSAKIVSPTQVEIMFTEAIQLGEPSTAATTAEINAAVKFYKGSSNVVMMATNAEITHIGDADPVTNTGNTIQLTFSNTFNPRDTGRVTITDAITSATNNGVNTPLLKFKGVVKYPVEAGQIPTILSAKITGSNEITIEFSEPVYAEKESFTKFTLTAGTDIKLGETRDITEVEYRDSDGNALNGSANSFNAFDALDENDRTSYTKLFLTVQGEKLPADATGTISIKSIGDNNDPVSLFDDDSIAVSSQSRYVVSDGQSPNLISANLTTPKQITIKFTEQIKASWPDFINLRVGETHRSTSGLIDDTGASSTTLTSDTINIGIIGKGIPTTEEDLLIDIVPFAFEDDDSTKMQLSLIDPAGNSLALTATQMGAVVADGAVLFDDTTPRVAIEHGFKNWPIDQGQIPMLDSATITGSNEITLKFSIPVNAILSDFTFTLTGETSPRILSNIQGSGTETITLTVSGASMPPEAQGTIDVAGTVVGTHSRVALVSITDRDVMPGQAPTLTSAKITGEKTVTVTFSVAVDVSTATFTFTVDNEADVRNILQNVQTSVPGAVALTLAGDALPADATGKIDITGVKNSNTNVVMESVSNYLVSDGQAPMVMSASITDNNTLTIMFTEPVNTSLNDYDNFMLTGGEGITTSQARGLTNFDHPDGKTVTLKITGANLPVDAEGTVDIKGDIVDLANNNLVAVSAHQVAPGQIPTIESAVFTGPQTATIKFSEPVNANITHFTQFRITSPSDSAITNYDLNIATITGSGTDTIGLVINGVIPKDATGTVDISDEIVDLATPPNSLAESVDDYEISADASPKIESAAITGPNTITIMYSEPVITRSADYVNLRITYTVDDTETTKPIQIDSDILGSGTATVTLTTRTEMPEDATGLINLRASQYETNTANERVYKTMVDNRGQLLAELVNDSGDYADRSDYPLKDGQLSTITSTFGIVRGVVFSDDNGNNVRDAGEDGIQAYVSLSTTDIKRQLSGNNGEYTMQHVSENTYDIMVETPTGFAPAPSQSITVKGGMDVSVNFALKPLVTVSGTVFNDANGNGSPDPGEGITGATVSIGANTGMTNDMGVYEIMNVPAGTYQATVTQSGYATISMTVTAMGGATADNTANFALGSVGTVMGTITNSANNEGISNVMVSITDDLTDMTDANGMYEIMNVPAGSQTISIMTPDDFIGDNSKSVTVTRGDSHTVDFALTPVGIITGTVSTSAGQGIADITVNITDADSTVIGTDMTDMDGAYTIDMVPTGTYDVILDVSDGYLGSTSMEVTVSQGMSASVDFELTPVGMVSGMVFSDTNSNGVKDDLETGLANVTISITDSLTAVTGNDGTYTISNVPVGDQVVTVTAPDTHFVEDMATVSVTVTRGSTETANFALVPKTVANTATISGVIFNDVNGDGMQDTNEGGYGIYSEMILTNITSGEVVKQDTDANGMYSFDVLAGNTYTIQTSFFPAGITVNDPDSSWYRENIIPTAGQTVTFDVGFHTVMEGEHSMLDLTVFIDANRNGVMDEGETGQPLLFTVYTYTIGPANVTTDAQGKLLLKLVPADWAITGLPVGYAPTLYSYERDDSTEGKNYLSNVLVADDPEPGSTHTMIIGLVPTS